MAEPFDDRLTLLERVQLLHDATLRRHGELLDRHDDSSLRRHGELLDRHNDSFVQLQAMFEQHRQLMCTLTEVLTSMETTLHAIKELLDRGNGH